MSYGDLGQPKAFVPAGDYSAVEKQYTFVKRGATAGQVETAGAGEAAIGVQWNRPEANQGLEAIVDEGSEPHVRAGEAISLDAEIASDADGKAVVAASGDVVLGIAHDSAPQDGFVKINLLTKGQYTKA